MSDQKTETEVRKPDLDKSLQNKYGRLQRIIQNAGSAAVAFSGGVDSTFLLKVCVDLLGENR
jgi:uncharacterized protein